MTAKITTLHAIRSVQRWHGNEGFARAIASTTSTSDRQVLRTSYQMSVVVIKTNSFKTNRLQFASLHVHGLGHHSLTHPLPRGQDIYQPSADGPQGSSYPFATLWHQGADTIAQLLKTLPDRAELVAALDMFQHKAQSCSFPHVPDNTTKREVLRFLDNADENAEKHPDMLALVFATLATGIQLGVYDRNGSLWVRGATEKATRQADVYRESFSQINAPICLIRSQLLPACKR